MKGKHHSEEAKLKMSLAKKGKPALWMRGENNYGWKGDRVGYNGLHRRVRINLGTPSICDLCKTKRSKRYEWANISHEYKTELNDWMRLCCSCHKKYDNQYRREVKNL